MVDEWSVHVLVGDGVYAYWLVNGVHVQWWMKRVYNVHVLFGEWSERVLGDELSVRAM